VRAEGDSKANAAHWLQHPSSFASLCTSGPFNGCEDRPGWNPTRMGVSALGRREQYSRVVRSAHSCITMEWITPALEAPSLASPAKSNLYKQIAMNWKVCARSRHTFRMSRRCQTMQPLPPVSTRYWLLAKLALTTVQKLFGRWESPRERI
jgi:hypothetical protein